MRNSGPRASGAEIALLVALLVWAIFPVVLLLVHASQTHTTITGADGLIGADGVLGADQLQYLAWARDAGSHGLAADLFTLAPNGHVYLEPLFQITGWLWKLGLSLPLAYFIWKPVGAVVLLLAAAAWARRAWGDQLGPRTATVILAVFLVTPVAALYSWTQTAGPTFRFNLYLLGDELLGAGKLWGYAPSAIAMALVPAALLCAERALDPDRGRRPGQRALRRRTEHGPLLASAAAALFATWLHPWQGITMIIIFVGLGVAQRGQGGAALILPACAAGVPLLYYLWLGHTDPAWTLASHYEVIPRLAPLVLLAGLGPLAVFAALGARRPDGDIFEQAVLLWVVAALITYFVNDAFADHALQGLSFPLGLLVVRGWRRLRLPVVLAVLGLAACTIPGLAFNARKMVNTTNSHLVQYYLTSRDQQALSYLRRAPPGGVLAPTPFAIAVPSQTGRRVWVGHGYWSRDYRVRARQVDALFKGRLRRGAAIAFVTSTGARLLIGDCSYRPDLGRLLRPIVAGEHRFGCARVYVLAAGRSARR